MSENIEFWRKDKLKTRFLRQPGFLRVGKHVWNKINVDNSCKNPKARYAHSMVSYDNKLLVFGGTNTTETFNDLWQYDCNTKQWKEIKLAGENTVIARYAHCATIQYILDQPIMIIHGGVGSKGKIIGGLCAYNIIHNQWVNITTVVLVPQVAFHSMEKLQTCQVNCKHLLFQEQQS